MKALHKQPFYHNIVIVCLQVEKSSDNMDSTDEGPGPMKQLEKNSNYNTALTLIVHHIFY